MVDRCIQIQIQERPDGFLAAFYPVRNGRRDPHPMARTRKYSTTTEARQTSEALFGDLEWRTAPESWPPRIRQYANFTWEDEI